MLNINFTKKKFTKLLLSINKLIESFFSRIDEYIKDYKRKNSKFKKVNSRVFLGLASLFVLTLVYFLIPSFYDEKSLKIKLENQIIDKYNLKVNFNGEISYALFPKPHFYVDDLSIFQKEKILINSKNTRIYLSIKNFLSFNNLKIKNIFFKNNEFNLKKENLIFFRNILNSNTSENDIIFKDSIMFYKDKFDDVVFLVDLNDLTFSYDIEKKYQLSANYKIFNLPFKLNLNHDHDNRSFFLNLESKNIRMKIENNTQYEKKNLKGLIEAQILNDTKAFDYLFKDNSLFIISEDEKFKGNVDLKPFYLDLDMNFDEFDIKNFLKENSIFINLINSEILNNQNINANINVNLNKIKNFKYLEKIFIKSVLEEGNIFLRDINTNWNDSVLIKINDTQLLNDGNKVNLVGSIIFDFIDLEKFYRHYQINKNQRDQIKKIKFDFFLNINDKQIQINNAKIDNLPNDKINNFLDDLNLQRTNFFNKVTFRNFIKDFFENYQKG